LYLTIKPYNMVHETVILFVKYVNNTPMGIFTMKDKHTYTGRIWWTDEVKIEVPTKVWLEERVNLSNINWYVEQYQENPKWWLVTEI